MLSFVVGLVAGGVAGFYCRGEINGYVRRQVPPLREQLADGVRTIEEATSGGLVRLRTEISTKLRNIEQTLRTANQPSAGAGTVAGSGPS